MADRLHLPISDKKRQSVFLSFCDVRDVALRSRGHFDVARCASVGKCLWRSHCRIPRPRVEFPLRFLPHCLRNAHHHWRPARVALCCSFCENVVSAQQSDIQQTLIVYMHYRNPPIPSFIQDGLSEEEVKKQVEKLLPKVNEVLGKNGG